MHYITFTHLYCKMSFREIAYSLIIAFLLYIKLLCFPQSSQGKKNQSILFKQAEWLHSGRRLNDQKKDVRGWRKKKE